MLPTPLSRGIGAAGILTVAVGGAMGSMPAVVAGSLLLIFLLTRGHIFSSKEKQVIKSFSCERTCDNSIVRQYSMITVTLAAHLDLPDGCSVTVRDMPGPGFEHVFEDPTLDPAYASEITYRIRAIARGAVVFHGVSIELTDPFFTSTVLFSRDQDRTPTINVQPAGSKVVSPGDSGIYGQKDSRMEISPTGSLIRSYREYISGDSLRQIDWKMTARADRLMIRETFAQRGEVPVIVLDIPQDASIRDMLIGYATGTVEASLRISHAVSLLAVSGGDVVRFLPDERQASRVLAAIRDLSLPSRKTHFYRYASDADILRTTTSTPPQSPLRTWYDAVLEKRGLPAFEAECVRAFSKTRGTSVILLSALSGDISHIGMIGRAAKRMGLDVHLRMPTQYSSRIYQQVYPFDSVGVI